jgi:phosphoribosylanthranilate isomerase
MTYIKICGITNLDDARCAARAGADMLGFILYPGSPRYVTGEQCARVVSAIRDELGARAPRCVGVFVNEPAHAVRAALEATGLDLAQLHGDEAADEVWQLSPRAFKAIRPENIEQGRAQAALYARASRDDETVPQLLVDAYHPQRYGGTGTMVDVDLARDLAGRYHVLLAGGLTPETVGMVVEQVRPWGVDVSSGVERENRRSPPGGGIKDHARVAAFVRAVRSADQATSRATGSPRQGKGEQ